VETLRILVTGGGTSGHISPALAVIQTLREQSTHDATWAPEFLYVGGVRGLEKEIVAKAGVPFIGVETGKLRRYLSVENLLDQFRLPVGLAQSLRIVRRFRPHVVFSTGGYVAVPPVLAARLCNVPILIHEQTVQIGLANRITARYATRIALSFESALPELTPSQRVKAFVSGNPVRPAIFNGDKSEAKKQFRFADEDNALPTVYVTGGSQGARVINRAVEDVLPSLLASCRIVHQCGRQPEGQEQDFDRLQRAAGVLAPQLQRRYFLTRFVGEEINHVFALADLVVGRAGAGTVAELCALGKPALYIPLVPTGGDEQTRNAQMCEKVGAAHILKQAHANGPNLLEAVQSLLYDRSHLEKMGAAARTLARLDAAGVLARAVVELAVNGMGSNRRDAETQRTA
jgi:UDP-N-acetylglucosamine--N-acetylmuramyl-(pentapeptide) pyrophosphoryl-undecaprenol N-acetylglucosamine transferase